jgi:hypothetical protein
LLTSRHVVVVLFAAAFGRSLSAQSIDAPRVTATLSNVTRVESWSYFTPPPGVESDPQYTFVADRAELGVRVDGSRFDIAAGFNYVRIENLPVNAIGPGGLGAGAFYFAAVGVPYSYQLYLSDLELRAKRRDGSLSITLGRMHYASGLEVTSHSTSLQRLKRERLASRLVGDFESSQYERRFDGVRIDANRHAWHASGSVLMPTQGGFEESANLTMPRVQVAVGSLTRTASPTREWQAFGVVYRDRRADLARPDNSALADGPARVTIGAIGGSFASVSQTTTGERDMVVWGAGQVGDWYGSGQRAFSFAAEAGHRWTRAALRPWIRGGYSYESGDGDPRDRRHGTFFQMLPSSRQYALSSAYTQMNLRDAFVQAWVEPARVSARVELHRLDLASGADLWYHGSGATASVPGRFFGFSGRRANGATSLGTVLETVVELPIARHWSLNGYAGTLWGGDVVKQSFAGHRLTTAFLESVVRF